MSLGPDSSEVEQFFCKDQATGAIPVRGFGETYDSREETIH